MKSKHKNLLFIIIMIIITNSIGIGYASISGVILDITGDASIKKEENTVITDVTFFSGTNVNNTLSSIKYNYGTLIDAHIVLGDSIDSSITYKVVISNRQNTPVKYRGDVVDPLFYDNELISYSVSGIVENEIIQPNTSKELYITFRYASEDTTHNVLNKAYINFKFSNSYFIKFNSNGGIGTMDDQIAYIGDFVTLNTSTFTNVNSSFSNWNTKEDETGSNYNDNGIYYNENDEVTEVNLYAFYHNPITDPEIVVDN